MPNLAIMFNRPYFKELLNNDLIQFLLFPAITPKGNVLSVYNNTIMIL